jgi:hypothetical protein
MGFQVTKNNSVRPKAGVLWKKAKKETGEEFYSGQIEITPDLLAKIQNAEISKNGRKYIDIVVFSNQKEPESKFPDMNIFFSEKRT